MSIGLIFVAAFEPDRDSVRDVQRFIELTDEARALLPSGLPIFDPEGASRSAPRSFSFRQRRLKLVRRSGSRVKDGGEASEREAAREVSRFRSRVGRSDRGTIKLTRNVKTIVDKALETHLTNEERLPRTLTAADQNTLDRLLRALLTRIETMPRHAKLKWSSLRHHSDDVY